MSEEKSNDWLWESLRADQADRDERPEDRLLRAYRAGELDPQAETELEWKLARSEAARLRLAELSGVVPAAPSEFARARTLGQTSNVTRRRVPFWAATAAVAALLLLTLWIGRPAPLPGLPSGLEFRISVEGLAEVRSGSDLGSTRAMADTPIRILVEPTERAVDGLQFFIYRQTVDSLVRVDDRSGVRVDVQRGAAAISADAASDLTGAELGVHELYVVVSRETDLPARVALTNDHPATEVLKELSSGRVYRRTLEIVLNREVSQ